MSEPLLPTRFTRNKTHLHALLVENQAWFCVQELGRLMGKHLVSRLISRLRHRQFGVIITTSWLHDQAYKEIVEDGHPVMILAGRDIVELLRETGLQDSNALTTWLNMSFPLNEV